MILKHKCGHPCIVDLSSSIKLEGIPAIVGNKISIVSLIINNVNKSKPKYFCKNCNKYFEEDELVISCITCNEPIYDNILLESPFGGIVCKDCVEKYEIKVINRIRKDSLVVE